MKIAVIADIHANYTALERVLDDVDRWAPDQVIVAGDVVNRGPRPSDCLRLVKERERTQGWRLVRGNHEDYVVHQARLEGQTLPMHRVHRASRWTYQQLDRDVSALRLMPFQQSLEGPDGEEIRAVHASMLGIRDGIYPFMDDGEIARRVGENPPAVFCVGHTHHYLVRQLPGTLVVNAGSAGLPFDGDTRAGYARIFRMAAGWQAEIIRLEYDLQRAEQDFVDYGYLAGGGPLIDLVRIELRQARSQLYGWSKRYQALAEQGEIGMRESVNRFLEEDD